MTEAVNLRGWPVQIAATGDVVAPGGSVDVPEDLARRLADQTENWDVPGLGPPDGSVDDVLEWVGADPDRARKAMAAEGDDGRSTLIEELEDIVGEEQT